ncbi:glomulin-like [Anneissia japonica]|uniref:glomulin-like n=1 Tax=Anneissia japonica TaxID=1529436 RepID=UPI0014258600|nr:glomulin-like [Anneissia japonica]
MDQDLENVLLSLEKNGRLDDDLCSLFLLAAKRCLEQQQSTALLDAVTKHEVLVEYTGWDLLPIVSPYLASDKVEERDEETHNNCVDIIQLIAKVGKPKEIVLGLLEQVDHFLDNMVYLDFINPLQIALCRLETGLELSLGLALSTVYAHVQTLKLPSYESLDEEELLLTTQDPDYRRLEETVTVLIDFVSPFVFKVVQAQKQDKDKLNNKTLIIKKDVELFLLKLLSYPLVFLSLVDTADENDTENKPVNNSTFCTCTQQIMNYFEEMSTSFPNMIFYATTHKPRRQEPATTEDRDASDEDGCTQLPPHGLACFAYLVLSVRLGEDHFPSIYSGQHVFQACVPYVVTLLERPQAYAVQKGLDLLSSTVGDIDHLSLPSMWLGKKGFTDVADNLLKIMIHCPTEKLRKKAVSLLKPFMMQWEFKGRYQLLRKLLSEATHAGVEGFLIGILKDFVHETLLQGSPSNTWFVDQHLVDICQYVFDLPDGAESDILERSDKIISALNFLRYLLLRDKFEVNATGVWTHVDELDERFLQPLHSGLDLSKAHYDLKLKEVQKTGQTKDDRVSVTVGGQNLPTMPIAQQKEVLRSAQFTFDLIASLLGRAGEVISMEKRTQKYSKS